MLGFDLGGRLTWFDGTTGKVLAQEAPRPEAAEALTRDVAYDHWQHRALVFESDAEDQGGEISVHPMAGAEPRFEPRRHWAWVDGRARLMALPYAALSFEEGYGERWKVLRDDGKPTVSVPAPRPASAWLEASGGGLRIGALAYESDGSTDGLSWVTATVTSTGVQPPETTSLGPSSASPPTARMVPAALTVGVFVADLRHGELVLSLYEADGTATAAWALGAGNGRIEQLLAMSTPDGHTERVAMLLSGPGQVVVADIEDRSVTVSRLVLAAPVKINDRFFGRELVAPSWDRLLVVTDLGVEAIDILDGKTQRPGLQLDESFRGGELRGPLARIID